VGAAREVREGSAAPEVRTVDSVVVIVAAMANSNLAASKPAIISVGAVAATGVGRLSLSRSKPEVPGENTI
jgi:hypothetical protein